MGISGRVARYFLDSRLTPLIAVLVVVLGLFAVLATPREEEPQVDVTMANVLIPFPGASAADVEMLVATPVEQVISQMPGLEHVFSVSQPGLALVTAQFKVGVPRLVAQKNDSQLPGPHPLSRTSARLSSLSPSFIPLTCT